jgi:hypothetical protein
VDQTYLLDSAVNPRRLQVAQNGALVALEFEGFSLIVGAQVAPAVAQEPQGP